MSTLSNGNLLIRIAPAALDASEFSFKMVNSKLEEAPITLGAPVAFNGLLTKAVSGNGLWSMPISANEGETYKNNDAYNAKFSVSSKAIAYALQEAEGFTTLYNLSFKYDNTINLTATPKTINEVILGTTTATPSAVTVGELLTVAFDNPQNVYDAYVEIDEATVVRWGITDINGLSFKVGKLADNITTTYFPITVHYVTLAGTYASGTYYIKPAKSLNGVTTLPTQNFEISATPANNKKDYSLAPMFEDLAGNALVLWKADVTNNPTIKVYRVESTGDVEETGLSNAVTFDKSTVKDITKLTLDVDAARTTEYKLDKSYYAKIDFKDANGEILNTVKAPFTLSIPALSKFLVKENVVFGTTSTGKAYMNMEDQAKPYVADGQSPDGKSRYAFKHAFNKFENVYANNSTITFAIDPAQKIGNTAIAGKYAKLINESAKDVAIELIETDGSQKAYHTPINIVISDAKYLGIYKYGDTERAANAFKLDVMSPIEQGTVEAASAAGISVVATSEGVAKLYEKDFKAATYAGIAYKIFKDKFATGDTEASLYTSPYISDVTFESANTNVFTVEKNGVGAKKNGNKVEEGYVEVTPKNAGYDTTVKLNVTVKDIWGYTKKADINVTVKPNSAN